MRIISAAFCSCSELALYFNFYPRKLHRCARCSVHDVFCMFRSTQVQPQIFLITFPLCALCVVKMGPKSKSHDHGAPPFNVGDYDWLHFFPFRHRKESKTKLKKVKRRTCCKARNNWWRIAHEVFERQSIANCKQKKSRRTFLAFPFEQVFIDLMQVRNALLFSQKIVLTRRGKNAIRLCHWHCIQRTRARLQERTYYNLLMHNAHPIREWCCLCARLSRRLLRTLSFYSSSQSGYKRPVAWCRTTRFFFFNFPVVTFPTYWHPLLIRLRNDGGNVFVLLFIFCSCHRRSLSCRASSSSPHTLYSFIYFNHKNEVESSHTTQSALSATLISVVCTQYARIALRHLFMSIAFVSYFLGFIFSLIPPIATAFYSILIRHTVILFVSGTQTDASATVSVYANVKYT